MKLTPVVYSHLPFISPVEASLPQQINYTTVFEISQAFLAINLQSQAKIVLVPLPFQGYTQ
jgi:hypothetical protein